MRSLPIFAALLSLPCQSVLAREPVFDVHVHLWEGQKSLQAYEEQLEAAGVEATGLAAMWFGGPNQALAGHLGSARRDNDEMIALAAAHPKLLPVATVHPYDGPAALSELARIAKRGAKNSQDSPSHSEV